MAAYAEFMTHVTCRLTAKNRDQLWNPTLGKGFTFNLYRRRTRIPTDIFCDALLLLTRVTFFGNELDC